jgi:ribosomal protein L37E
VVMCSVLWTIASVVCIARFFPRVPSQISAIRRRDMQCGGCGELAYLVDGVLCEPCDYDFERLNRYQSKED